MRGKFVAGRPFRMGSRPVWQTGRSAGSRRPFPERRDTESKGKTYSVEYSTDIPKSPWGISHLRPRTPHRSQRPMSSRYSLRPHVESSPDRSYRDGIAPSARTRTDGPTTPYPSSKDHTRPSYSHTHAHCCAGQTLVRTMPTRHPTHPPRVRTFLHRHHMSSSGLTICTLALEERRKLFSPRLTVRFVRHSRPPRLPSSVTPPKRTRLDSP